MEYIKVSEAAKKWNISDRRVRLLCAEDKIPGAIKNGGIYLIPSDAEKPIDGRAKSSKLIDEVEEKKEYLSTLRPLTKGEIEKLREEFMIEFTYNSNAIEGNTLTLNETAMALSGMTIDQKPLKDHMEAVGHRDAFLFVLDIASKEIPLDESVIKQIHSLVLIDRPEDKGTYRKIPVKIMGAYTQPVQPYLIDEKIKELLTLDEKRKGSLSDIERIALFHLQFEGIHPFIDGNGRTGRLILNLDLIRCGYPPINVKFLDRKKYYEAFDEYYKKGSPKAMTTLIANYVNEKLDEYIEILK